MVTNVFIITINFYEENLNFKVLNVKTWIIDLSNIFTL